MSRRAEIQIGELVFASKEQAAQYFHDMLYRYALGDTITGTDARELLWLLERHHEFEQKHGVGILYFRIIQAPYSARGFGITRTDWTTTDFSYRKCIYNSGTPLQALIRVFRKEVDDDILQAKLRYFAENGDELGRVACKETGALVSIEESEAHHAPPHTLDVLAKLFLSARKIVPDWALLAPLADNEFGRSLVDRALAAEWREFHNQHADICIISTLENRKISQEGRRKADNRQLILPTESNPLALSDKDLEDTALELSAETLEDPS
jgi:hypothetical protein